MTSTKGRKYNQVKSKRCASKFLVKAARRRACDKSTVKVFTKNLGAERDLKISVL